MDLVDHEPLSMLVPVDDLQLDVLDVLSPITFIFPSHNLLSLQRSILGLSVAYIALVASLQLGNYVVDRLLIDQQTKIFQINFSIPFAAKEISC